MTRSTGLGDGMLVSGYDVSGDVGSIGSIQSTWGEQEMTSLAMSAMDRAQNIENGSLSFNNFFNDSNGEGLEARGVHDILTDATTPGRRFQHLVSYYRGRALGAWVANMDAMVFSYSLARSQSGNLLGTVSASSTGGEPIQWARALTPFIGDDVPAEPEPCDPWDDTVYAAFQLGEASFRAWLHLIEFDDGMCGDAVIKIQDSANGTTGWADVVTLWDSACDDPPPAALSVDYTSDDAADYLRVIVETTAGFTALRIAVSVKGL